MGNRMNSSRCPSKNSHKNATNNRDLFEKVHLQETNISPQKWHFESMIFPTSRLVGYVSIPWSIHLLWNKFLGIDSVHRLRFWHLNGRFGGALCLRYQHCRGALSKEVWPRGGGGWGGWGVVKDRWNFDSLIGGDWLMRELWDDGWWWWIKLIQLICLFFTSLVISYMFCFWLKLPKRCSVSVSRIRTDFSCRLFYGSGTNSFPLSCQSGGIPERLRLSDGFPGILGLHAHLGLDIRLFFHLFSAATWAQYGGLKRVQFFWHFPLCDWWKKTHETGY